MVPTEPSRRAPRAAHRSGVPRSSARLETAAAPRRAVRRDRRRRDRAETSPARARRARRRRAAQQRAVEDQRALRSSGNSASMIVDASAHGERARLSQCRRRAGSVAHGRDGSHSASAAPARRAIRRARLLRGGARSRAAAAVRGLPRAGRRRRAVRRPAGRSCRSSRRPYCERLGIPFVYDPGPGILSMEAIADPPAYRPRARRGALRRVSRALVHALKYGDRLDLAPMMGRWMARAGRELLAEADALVPVPLHWRRQWARRFNQSAHAGRGAIAQRSGVPVAADALKRVQAPPPSRSACRAPSAPPTSRAPSASRGRQGRGRGPAAGSGRRRADLRRHRRRLRAGLAAGRRRERRRAGFRQGCRSGANAPYKDDRQQRTLRASSWPTVEIYTSRSAPTAPRQGAA